MQLIDLEFAKQKLRSGDIDGAVELLRELVDDEYETGEMAFRAKAVSDLVEALSQRGTAADLQEAQHEVDRLAAVPTDPAFVLHDVQLLRMRALLAQARGDAIAYRDFADRYRALATSCGFEGHMAMAEAMR